MDDRTMARIDRGQRSLTFGGERMLSDLEMMRRRLARVTRSDLERYAWIVWANERRRRERA